MRLEKNKRSHIMLMWFFGVVASIFVALPGLARSVKDKYAEDFAEIRKKLPEMIKKTESGSTADQLMLGFVYAAGVEGKPNYKKALYWYEKAASQGRDIACYMAYVLYVEGMGTKRDLNKAEKWARKLVEMDREEGYLLLGALYDKGAGSRRNYAKAAEYYSKADRGRSDIGGTYRLGMFYLEGKGVTADKKKGLRYLEEAADNQDIHAAFQLGMMYYEGKDVEQDDKKAFYYFEEATYQRSSGMFNFGPDLFGEAYLPGQEYTRGVGRLMDKDPNVHAEAYYMMGLMAERGRGVEKNRHLAMKYYESAIEENHQLAKQRLGILKALEENAEDDK